MEIISRVKNIGRTFHGGQKDKYRGLQWQVLILLPAVLCIVLFLGVYALVNSQAQSRAEMIADNFEVKCNAIFHEMEIVGNTLKDDTTLKQYLSADEFSYTDAVLVCSVIDNYKKECPYINQILVISDKMSHIYTDSAFLTLSSLPVFLSQNGISEDVYESFGDESELYIGYGTSSLYYYTPVTDNNGNKTASMIVTLKNSALKDLFKSMNISFCGIYSNNNPDYYICSHIIPVSLNLNWLDSRDISDFVGESITLFYLSDSLFTYVVAISRAAFYQPLLIILIFFIIYFIVLLAVHIGYLYNQQRKRSWDIETLISELPEQSAGSDYDTVLDNVKEALTDYRRQREDNTFTQKSSVVNGILRGYYNNGISPEILAKAGLPDYHSYYCVVGFHILDLSAVDNYQSSDSKERLEDSILIMINSALGTLTASESSISFTSAVNNYYNCLNVIFFSKTADKFEDNVLSVCSDLTSLFIRDYGISIQAAISDMVTECNDLPSAYTQIRNLRDFAVSTGNTSQVICQTQFLSADNNSTYSNFLQNEEVLLNTLITKKYEMVPGMVESMFSNTQILPGDQYQSINNQINDIKNILLEGIYTCDCLDLIDPKSIDVLRNANSIPDVVNAASEVYTQISSLSDAGVTDATSIACKYIEENISDENLSVSKIADYAGVSTRHLTELFKNHFNMTIADYVNHKRISMAKDLLKDPKIKISQVSKQVGYYSTDTFTRNFRKLEGVTPTEYRDLINLN